MRPVSARDGQEVSEDERQYEDGSDPQVLDIIDVPILGPRPRDYQTENWVFAPELYWEKVARLSSLDLPGLADPIDPLWIDGHSTYNGRNGKIRQDEKRKMSAKDNDFNWVDALNNCSVAREFEALKQTVEANVEERLRQVGAVSNIAPSFQNRSEKEFVVIRHSPLRGGAFRLQGNRIFVEDNEGNKQFELTLALNDDGECRFKVDGEGEFLRWQVARKALEDIFFF